MAAPLCAGRMLVAFGGINSARHSRLEHILRNHVGLLSVWNYRKNSSSTMAATPTSPPDSLMKPMSFPFKTLMGPGPSNCPPRVLNASALPMLGHLHPEFVKIMDEVKEGIKYIFQTQNEWTLCVSGTGHAAMEAAVCNTMEQGDKVLVCTNGIWGERFAEMADRHGADVVQITTPMGTTFNLEQIEKGLKENKPAIVFITQGESSGTTLQPLEGVGALCHNVFKSLNPPNTPYVVLSNSKDPDRRAPIGPLSSGSIRYNSLLIVDSVAACGGVPLFMDKWEIDVLYTGAQKVLSAPPGASPISFSDRAKAKVLNRKSKVRSYYFDMNHLANYWGCEKDARRYHHTGPISSVYALREGLARLAEESLEKSWENHRKNVEYMHEGLEALGLEMLVKNKADRLPCVSGIKVPEGMMWKDVSDFAMQNYRVEISGGLGSQAGKIWRVGLMGYNCTRDNVNLLLRAFKEGLEHVRKSKS